MNPLSLKGKSALVTGSSRGIGNSIARAMQEAGARVIFHGGKPQAEVSLPDEKYVQQNLLEDGAADKLMRGALEIEPELDVLICNAGAFFDLPFLEMTRERWDKTMNLNLREAYFLIQAFARHLVGKKKTGSVTIVGSTNGVQAEMDSTAYDISKGGIVMMVRSIALNLGDHGIRVNGVAPGLIRTDATSWLDHKPEVRAHYEKKVALGRIGKPDECGGACVFLSSDAARYITGDIITVDGGLILGQIGKL